MILPSGSRPNGTQLAQAGGDAKGTQDAENEAIEESDRAARRQYKSD